jgi:hypothetical protein
MAKPAKCGYVLIRLPAQLHKKLRIYAAEREMSMQKMLYDYIFKLVEDKKCQ